MVAPSLSDDAFHLARRMANRRYGGRNVSALPRDIHLPRLVSGPGSERRLPAGPGGRAFLWIGLPALDLNGLSQRALQAHRQEGARSFQKLNGGWVAVVWDREKQQAHFVRDPVGTQPFYAMRWQDQIVFATDLRVFQSSDMLGPMDDQALAEFLHFLYIPPPRTISQGCVGVQAGHVLTFGDDSPAGEIRAAPLR